MQLADSLMESWLSKPVSVALGLDELKRVQEAIPLATHERETFFDCALRTLRIPVEFSEADVERIPAAGPAIVVANHPFGGIDGLVAGAVVGRRRRDFRVLANSWLKKIPELAPWLIDVDVFEVESNASSNAMALKRALKFLRDGGALIVFPAGVVAHFRAGTGRVDEAPWNRAVATLARRSGATVVPMYFPGANRVSFHVAGLVHARLRTALLPRELLARRGKPIRLRIGDAISARATRGCDSDEALAAWMRVRTEALRQGGGGRRVRWPRWSWPRAPVAKHEERALLEREWAALPRENELELSGRYRVLRARAEQIPHTLREIGRLREITFRAVGEGTGRSRDLDRFDGHYDHLFVVDREKGLLVGAYRVGACDRILRERGLAGLYTHSLFTLKRPALARFSTALELGRSFVRTEYQRQALPLALLWRGIGRMLVDEPRYDTLIGPASFSPESGPVIQRLGAALLSRIGGHPELSRCVRARRPLHGELSSAERDFVAQFRGSLRDVVALLGELDETGRGVPILLQRYMQLGGNVLAFSVDPGFGGCMDAFVFVDVAGSAPRATLERFMTKEGLGRYLQSHGKADEWLRLQSASPKGKAA